jgi:ATP-binding cassette subfamily C protein CydD
MRRGNSPESHVASSERSDRGAERALERRLWAEHPRARRVLGLAIGLSFAATACGLAVALLLSTVVDRVFLGSRTLAGVAGMLAVLLALQVLRGALLWSGEVAAQRSAEDLKASLRGRYGSALVELGPMYARRERAGELVHTAGEGLEAIDGYVTRFRPARALGVLVPVVVAALVFAIDPWTVSILVVTGPVLVLLLSLIGRRVRDQTRRRERELAWMSAHFLDVLHGLTTLKMFGRSAEQADTIEEVGRRYGTTTMDVLRTAFQTTLVLEWGATAATALVAIEASVRLMAGDLPFGRALAVLLLVPEFFVPLRRLAAEYHTGRAGTTAASRLYAILDEPGRITGTTHGLEPALPSTFDVRFEDVAVSFDDGARIALAGCSFEIPDGALAVLVGPTGAGKSTVANVLLRFVDPDRGRVVVGGRPLADLEPERWRTLVAYVPQHPYLFRGSVADNLRLSRPSATDEDLVRAALAADAHGFIQRLPDGYATDVGEGGAGLSGGERQRLAIARAVLKDAPLLILDEPVSQLDDESGSAVTRAIESLARSRTTLLIAHRPGVIAADHRVVTLDGGRVVELGAAEVRS